MPIRINLLAEAQAAEEMRRKDPVKRVIYGAAAVVALVALWVGSLQMKVMSANGDLAALETEWNGLSEGYTTAVRLQRENIDVTQKIDALNNLATNRFLWGNALNALQQTLDGVKGVKALRIATDQQYTVTEDSVPAPGSPEPPVPGTSTERISIVIEAIDASHPSGGQVAVFKNRIGSIPYFSKNLTQTNGIRLASLSAPQVDDVSGRSFVRFSMKCLFPDKVR